MFKIEAAGTTEQLNTSNWRRLACEAVFIAGLAATLNFAGNGRMSLWDRDEPRYATCTREMRASGDWIHPTFNAEPRYHKPILIYWLMLAGTALGGDNPFGVRLVSACAGVATSLLVWIMGRRMLGPKAGLLAGLIITTAPLMVVESKLATTDATLVLFLMICWWSLWELARSPSRLAAGAFWVSLALAMLTKGPVGPAFIALAGLVSWRLGGPVACWRRLHWRWGLAGFVLITAPWYIAIGIVTRGAFYKVALGYHVVQRMTTGIEEHGAFPGYYVATFFLTFFPWSALMPAALFAGWVRRKESPALGFLLGWVIGPLVLLELVRTKLVHYMFPVFPACALLVAWLVVELATSELNLRRCRLGRLGVGILSGIGVTVTVALLAGALVLPGALRWPSLAMGLGLGIGTLCSTEMLHRGKTERAVWSMAGCSGVVLLMSVGWALPALEPYRVTRRVGERLGVLAAQENASPMLATFQEPSIIYALGQPAKILRDKKVLLRDVQKGGGVVTALMDHEIKILRAEPRLAIELREIVQGFNINKGRTDTLHIAVLRPRSSDVARQGEQASVK